MRRSAQGQPSANFLIYSTIPSILTYCSTWNLTGPKWHCTADFSKRLSSNTSHTSSLKVGCITSHSPFHFCTLFLLTFLKPKFSLPLSVPPHLIHHYLTASSHCLICVLLNHHGVLILDLSNTLFLSHWISYNPVLFFTISH